MKKLISMMLIVIVCFSQIQMFKVQGAENDNSIAFSSKCSLCTLD
jgi:hypothetical protein